MEQVTSGGRFRPTPFLVTVTMIVVVGTIWLLLNPSVWQRRALERQLRQLREEVGQLEARRAGLERTQEAFQNDPGALEREVRGQLGLVRPGEVALLPTPASPLPAAESGPAAKWISAGIYTILGLLALSWGALLVGCLLERKASC